MAAAATVRARKLAATHPTACRGITRFHHPPVTARGWTTRAMPRARGTAAMNNHDTGTTANPKRSTTLGARKKAATRVAPTPLTRSLGMVGGGVVPGQANLTQTAVSAPRPARMAAASAPKAGHELVYTLSHRKSWNTPKGATALA